MKSILFLLFILLNSAIYTFAQDNFRVVFYNLENLFDTIDNPEKEDDEFLPQSNRRWTQSRYQNKIDNLGRVLALAGEDKTPFLVGLCEIENEKVLEDLIASQSELTQLNYGYIISDCEDRRGINTALLYKKDKLNYIAHHFYRPILPANPEKKTRDILHFSGEFISKDTIDVFVIHFPSRREGKKKTQPDRVAVADLLKDKTDSVIKIRENANILIMGDFNEEPSAVCIHEALNAGPIPDFPDKQFLYNLFYPIENIKDVGSYKYRKQWNIPDQIIVSGNLISGNESLKILPGTASVLQFDFMLTEDKTHGGKRPWKTFHGYIYEGGFSDHLPLIVDFVITDLQNSEVKSLGNSSN